MLAAKNRTNNENRNGHKGMAYKNCLDMVDSLFGIYTLKKSFRIIAVHLLVYRRLFSQ